METGLVKFTVMRSAEPVNIARVVVVPVVRLNGRR